MDFDELFTELGDYGRYQRLMLWFVLFPAQLPYLCQVYCHIFMSLTPDHWCKVSLLDHLNVTDNFSRHLFVPKKNNILHSLEYEQCSVYNISYQTLLMHSIQIGWIPNQTWPITKCTEGWVYNRTLLGLDNSIITKWDLVCDHSMKQIIPITIFFFGSFIGLIVGYILSNIFGRKRIYFLMLLLQCLFGVWTAFASNFEIFCIMRFGVGFSIPTITVIPHTLSLELTPQHERANVLLLNELFRNIGALILVVVSYFIRDYNHLTVAINVPFVIFIFFWWLFPESPKWLILNERIEQVDKLVKDIAETNVRFLSPDFSITLRRRIRIECALLRETKSNQNNSLLIKLLYLPNMRKKVIILCWLYITHFFANIGFTYYVLEFTETRGNGDIYFQFVVAIAANYLGLLIAHITLKRFGRKCTISIGNILSALFSIMSAFAKNKDTNLCLIYYASAKIFLSCSYSSLTIWMHELLPLSYCSQAIDICVTLGQLSSVAVPLVLFYSKNIEINLSHELHLSTCLTIFGFLFLINGLLSFTLPETCNNKLPKNLEEAEAIGKYSSWKNFFWFQTQKKVPKNGILKNKGPQQQSPILSLLRKQESMRQNEYDVDSNDKINDLKDSPNNICTIKITVL